MRNLIIAFLLLTSSSFAQGSLPHIDGMLGIPFGKTKIDCINAMKAKGYKLAPDQSGFLNFDNVNYSKWSDASAGFFFEGGKFYKGVIILLPTSKPKLLKDYNDLLSDLNEKYGESIETRDFEFPYKNGDGHEIDAICGGYATFNNVWQDSTGTRLIKSTLEKEGMISVIYSDMEVSQKKAHESKQRRLKDM